MSMNELIGFGVFVLLIAIAVAITDYVEFKRDMKILEVVLRNKGRK